MIISVCCSASSQLDVLPAVALVGALVDSLDFLLGHADSPGMRLMLSVKCKLAVGAERDCRLSLNLGCGGAGQSIIDTNMLVFYSDVKILVSLLRFFFFFGEKVTSHLRGCLLPMNLMSGVCLYLTCI